MTEIEVAELVVKQNGSCIKPISIDCDYCPAFRIYQEKGLDYCYELWDNDVIRCKQWFENFFKENYQSECKVIVNDNIEEKLDKIIKLLKDIKNKN